MSSNTGMLFTTMFNILKPVRLCIRTFCFYLETFFPIAGISKLSEKSQMVNRIGFLATYGLLHNLGFGHAFLFFVFVLQHSAQHVLKFIYVIA